MSNILNHNRNLFDFIIDREDYWDFRLSEEVGYGADNNSSNDCLSAYVDFNDPDCVFYDDAFSKQDYVWGNSINDGVDLNYIGVTGVDNGFIKYQKDRITNRDFLKIFLHSSYNTETDDKRFHLRKVDGNNQIYDYSNDITYIDGMDVSRLNGGFYQGFFKIPEKNYQVLPYQIEDGWCFEVTLKKSELVNEKTTINDSHPNNKGYFLYIGTRAENKWWEKYNTDHTFDISPASYDSDGSISDEYATNDTDVNSNYLMEDEDGRIYLDEVYDVDCKDTTHYVDDGYLDEEDEKISGDEELFTEDGISFNQPNVFKYETDNKFLLFNRTSEGFNTHNWEEGTKAIIYDIKRPDLGNYFTLFNRTPSGYNTKNIDGIIEDNNKSYNVLKDLYRNALGFQIKDDGSIGFRYLVKDCDSEEEKYKIEELFSNPNVIKEDEWTKVSIRIVPTVVRNFDNPLCDNLSMSSSDEMIIYIYVDGKLRLKSENLPILNLKTLDDLSDKQQGVPFNISLGGGTQGLCDVIRINYRELPKYMLPLEKEFCGSFIGYIKEFKIYTCPINFFEIQRNYEMNH